MGSFPVCDVASEIAIEDRSEECFIADMPLCAISSEAKIKRLKKKKNIIQVVLTH